MDTPTEKPITNPVETGEDPVPAAPSKEDSTEAGTIPESDTFNRELGTEEKSGTAPEESKIETTTVGVSKELEKRHLLPPRKRLSGACRKRVKRLVQCGTDHETAVAIVLQAKEMSLHLPKIAARLRQDHSSLGGSAKKQVGGIEVGVIASNPQTMMTTNQLDMLKTAILRQTFCCKQEVGTQIRFLGCTYKPGWLLIKCADEVTVSWLTKCVSHLNPWVGASLRAVQGEELPKPQICIAYIPDPPSRERPSPSEVLAGLRFMNANLSTSNWVVLEQQVSGPGRIWTFYIDDSSMHGLKSLDMMPYYGFGRVTFRVIEKGTNPSKIWTCGSTSASSAGQVGGAGHESAPTTGPCT
ncbi:uncharacterized protein LOC123308619 [Coccinella septempunctata]|uniref:uncharacterized protein LOC123308619 n=1 Tax=Coccinella septempunctata TaxID=41139 RepID=UPI001D0949B8|nr:uncharacterized protein LOC123308619 [Coccinella septempunctata]